MYIKSKDFTRKSKSARTCQPFGSNFLQYSQDKFVILKIVCYFL